MSPEDLAIKLARHLSMSEPEARRKIERLSRVASLESQVATLTALAAEHAAAVMELTGAVAELQRRVEQLESGRWLYAIRPDPPSVQVPDFQPPLQPESAPGGPRADLPRRDCSSGLRGEP